MKERNALIQKYNTTVEIGRDLLQDYEALEEDSSQALRAAELKHESLSQEYSLLLQSKEDDSEKALEAAESKYEDLSQRHKHLRQLYGQLSFEHERDAKVLKAAASFYQKQRDHIHEILAILQAEN